MNPNPEHQRIIQSWFFNILAEGQFDLLDDLLAPGFVVRDPGDTVSTANAADFKTWLHWYSTSFTDQKWTIHEILSVGDKAVVRYSGATTYRGGLFDLPPTNMPVREIGILMFRIANGQVQELWTALCDLDLIFALGGKVIPASGQIRDETAGTG